MAARRLHNLIYATIVNCCLYIIVVGVALGTNKWYSGSTREEDYSGTGLLKVEMSYGLFSGTKTKTGAGPAAEYKMKIVCKGINGCMFSCRNTGADRRQDIEDMLAGATGTSDSLCSASDTNSVRSLENGNRTSILLQNGSERKFINIGFYAMTIVCLCLGMLFALLSGACALYNTYRTPIQPALSVFGLYIWNALTSIFALLGMIMWGVEFAIVLKENAAISDTLTGQYDSKGRGSLGVSFWILILPILFPVANIVLLKYRSWKIVKMNEKNVRVIQQKVENGDTLLF